jgi:DNA-binding transcriptional regulator YiaG
MSVRFRNLDVGADAPVATWPTEGVIAALERGSLSDWRRIATSVRDDPWGPVARRLEDALATTRPYGVAALMERMLQDARQRAQADERVEVARRVDELLQASGLSRGAFAEAIGTSTSRLSTYVTGRVAPTSTLLVRMERVARQRQGGEGRSP